MPSRNPAVIYRPARPERQSGPRCEDNNGYYLVTQGHRIVFAYNGCYFRAGEIFADLVAMLDGESGENLNRLLSGDFAVWLEGRILGVIHQPWDDPDFQSRIVRFDEKGNTPDDYFDVAVPGWPTREQWLADGGDEIVVRLP